MLALVLALVAGVCLAAGWLLEQITLVYVALGVSTAGFVMIAANVWLRRRRAKKDRLVLEALDGTDVDEADVVEPEELAAAPEVDDDAKVVLSGGERLAEDATVYVVSGRKRFHLDDCRLIGGRATEELTLVEAREEAFTPCTICVEAESSELLARQH